MCPAYCLSSIMLKSTPLLDSYNQSLGMRNRPAKSVDRNRASRRKSQDNNSRPRYEHKTRLPEATELCRIGLTVQTHPNYQYRPCWSAGECKHDIPLARMCFRKSVGIKPILQSSVLTSLCWVEPPSQPINLDLFPNRLRAEAFERYFSEVSSRTVLCVHECIAYRLPTSRTVILTTAVRHIWCHRKSWNIFNDMLIRTQSTSHHKGPHNILEVIHVHVVADQDDPVDQHAAFVVEEDLTQLFQKKIKKCLGLVSRARSFSVSIWRASHVPIDSSDAQASLTGRPRSLQSERTSPAANAVVMC